jgi:serine/threonine-protein kinase
MRIKKTIPDWLVGISVMLFFLLITTTGIVDFTTSMEMQTFDFRARMAAPAERNPDIEIVAITDDDLSELGRFPWSRKIIAQGLQNLAKANARTIALNILFIEPEESAGLKAIKSLKEAYVHLGLPQQESGQTFYHALAAAENDLDNDAKLYDAIKQAGNVVLPVYFDTQSTGRDATAPAFITRHALPPEQIQELHHDRASPPLLWLSKVKPLLPALAEVAAGIGHTNLFPDYDGFIRHQVHLVGYLRGSYVPSYPLAIVKAFKGLSHEDISVMLGQGVSLRISPAQVTEVPVVSPRMETLINWHAGPGVAFHYTPFARVYKNEFQAGLFKDKIVIIGPTAPGIGDRFVTPISGNLPGVDLVANSVANILQQRFFSRPTWIKGLELGMLFLFGLYIAFVLPRLKAGLGALTTFGLFVSYALAGIILFFSYDIWLRISAPIMLLGVGYTLVISQRFFSTEKSKEKVEADSVETNKMLGLSFQQQGMLDLALEKFRKIPLTEGAQELLYNLGLDFERKRQFSKALATYKLIVEDGKNYKDLDERIPKLKGAEATMLFGARGTTHPGDLEATLLNTATRPTLGRYEVVAELGRGSMGVVYKGEDPKIHRTVAIKTVHLSEFDDDMVHEMKQRFFREAESAGLLTHPHIVTIYDCGEEHDLAYIAMEFLDGHDLKEYVKQEHLLPLRETLSIVADVAEALDYAHTKGVVHRDIKPANIMRLKETRQVKVTDFGIARITSSSTTQTGVILGTPSYMSPEQIAGQKVDGRSDIFSLGVVLFEMLTGQRPFTGEDMTTLMFRIAKEKHPAVTTINAHLPKVVERIIDKALEKDLHSRYQRAGEMADHLRKVVGRIDEIEARRASQTKHQRHEC